MELIIKALAWTFIHSLWQGLLAALIAAIIMSATKKSTARLRYNLLGILLLIFVVTTSFTFMVEYKEYLSSAGNLSENTLAVNNSDADDISIASGDIITSIDNWVNSNSSLLLLIWAAFFLFHCLKIFLGLNVVNRLRNQKVHPVSKYWKVKLEELREKLFISQPVVLLQSELAKVPVALGFFKPVILLPLGLIASIPAEQVETILLHELAHIRRRDYVVNILQNITEAVFFFNPAFLWISFLLRQEREACCDDIVIRNSPEKRSYFDALVSFQEYYIRQVSFAMTIGTRRQYLLARVKRMITRENKGINFFEKIALFAGVILFSAFTYVSNKKDEPAKQIHQFTGFEILPFTPKPKKTNQVKKSVKPPVRTIVVTDTIPKKKDTLTKSKPTGQNKTLPTENDWKKAASKAENDWKKSAPQVEKDWKKIDAESTDWKKKEPSESEKTLGEIIKLKDQIGVKKENHRAEKGDIG